MNLLFSKVYGYIAAAFTAVIGVLVALLMYSDNRRKAAERKANIALVKASQEERERRHLEVVARDERIAAFEGRANIETARKEAQEGRRDYFETQ